MKSFLQKLGLVLLTGLALAGCVSDETASSEEVSSEGNNDQSLVVYTNSLDDEKET